VKSFLKIMKLSFKQKNALRLGLLILIFLGILVFIYFQLKDEDKYTTDLDNLEKEMSSKEKISIRNNINEAGGLKIQQYAANGALRNDGKITVNEIAKIHELDNK
jgi:hypothetical protein